MCVRQLFAYTITLTTSYGTEVKVWSLCLQLCAKKKKKRGRKQWMQVRFQTCINSHSHSHTEWFPNSQSRKTSWWTHVMWCLRLSRSPILKFEVTLRQNRNWKLFSRMIRILWVTSFTINCKREVTALYTIWHLQTKTNFCLASCEREGKDWDAGCTRMPTPLIVPSSNSRWNCLACNSPYQPPDLLLRLGDYVKHGITLVCWAATGWSAGERGK